MRSTSGYWSASGLGVLAQPGWLALGVVIGTAWQLQQQELWPLGWHVLPAVLVAGAGAAIARGRAGRGGAAVGWLATAICAGMRNSSAWIVA